MPKKNAYFSDRRNSSCVNPLKRKSLFAVCRNSI